MEIGQRVLLDVFIIFVAAKLGGWLFARLGQPLVLGELVAGMLISPYALGLIGRPDSELATRLGGEEAARAALQAAYWTLAELGLVFLLFFVGLETRIQEIFRVGRRAVVVAVLGVTLPFALGYLYTRVLGREDIEALFVGAALVATSTGITARALRDMGVIRTTEARVILGAAVIDDVLSLLVLAVLGGLGGAARSTPADLVFLVVEALAFIVFVGLVGSGVVRRYGPHLRRTGQNAPLILAVGICLGLAALAGRIGLSPIIGAFLAGMVLAEARAHFDIERAALPVYELLVPFFFVVVGTQVDLAVFQDAQVLAMAVAITGLAIIGKLVGCGLGAWALGRRSALIIGVGMVPRGEVGIVVVSLGRALDAVPTEIFSIIVVMSLLTTMIVPPILTRLYAGPLRQPAVPLAEGEVIQEGHLPDLGMGHRALGEPRGGSLDTARCQLRTHPSESTHLEEAA